MDREHEKMIPRCQETDIDAMHAIINDAASACEGVIPADRWQVPYMPMEELHQEIADGVEFWGDEEGGRLLGVMGIQKVRDVTLIRHAYVTTAHRDRGIGSRLLAHLRPMTDRPVLIGTWRDAHWAIRFYEKHGVRCLPREESSRLLRRYWSIPERQVETSIVLAEQDA